MFFYKINKILQYLSHVCIPNIHLKKLCLETTLEGIKPGNYLTVY
jgi:hypothetical protein